MDVPITPQAGAVAIIGTLPHQMHHLPSPPAGAVVLQGHPPTVKVETPNAAPAAPVLTVT